MATLHKNKNIFQKLSPMWAVLMTAAHCFVCWYVYFGAEDLLLIHRYESAYRYLIWAAFEAVLFFSFAGNDVTELARHITFYLVAAAAGCGAIFYWAQNFFAPDTSAAFWQIYSLIYNVYSYSREMFYKIVVNSVGLIAVGGLFCAYKLGRNNSGWLKKHTH